MVTSKVLKHGAKMKSARNWIKYLMLARFLLRTKAGVWVCGYNILSKVSIDDYEFYLQYRGRIEMG